MKVVVNDRTEFDLARWNANEFNENMTLYINSTDLSAIRDAFYRIQKISIMSGENIIAQYVVFDTFSQIAYIGTQFVEERGAFVETMAVTLTKTDIIDQIQRIEDKMNNVVDPETLSLEELREYKLSQISADCSADIYGGETIELSDGTQQKFEYDVHDQLNLDQLFNLCVFAPEIQQYPYHQRYGNCQFYSRLDIITISTTLLLRKTQLITYCNQLNQYVRGISDRDELMTVEYGMTLPQEYQDRISEIIGSTMAQMQEFIARIIEG